MAQKVPMWLMRRPNGAWGGLCPAGEKATTCIWVKHGAEPSRVHPSLRDSQSGLDKLARWDIDRLLL